MIGIKSTSDLEVGLSQLRHEVNVVITSWEGKCGRSVYPSLSKKQKNKKKEEKVQVVI